MLRALLIGGDPKADDQSYDHGPVMVTHANGSSGYIPDDAAFDRVSYEITTSRLKPSCAENAIVDSFLRLMEQR